MQNLRFLKVSRGHWDENNPSVPYMMTVDERAVSSFFDLADCHDEEASFFYLADDGQLYPVTQGDSHRINEDEENPFHFAASALIANGQVVGHIVHTDH